MSGILYVLLPSVSIKVICLVLIKLFVLFVDCLFAWVFKLLYFIDSPLTCMFTTAQEHWYMCLHCWILSHLFGRLPVNLTLICWLVSHIFPRLQILVPPCCGGEALDINSVKVVRTLCAIESLPDRLGRIYSLLLVSCTWCHCYLRCSLRLSFSYWFSVWMMCPLLKVGNRSPLLL